MGVAVRQIKESFLIETRIIPSSVGVESTAKRFSRDWEVIIITVRRTYQLQIVELQTENSVTKIIPTFVFTELHENWQA